MQDIAITYRFTVKGGDAFSFSFVLDPRTARSRTTQPSRPQAWTALASHRCPHCTLPDAEGAQCPVAVSIENLITTLGFLISYEAVHLEIVTRERTVAATVPAQNAIGSLLGLAIATSGCPHTAFLKPMARFHLPLASFEETLFRVVGTYLIGEHFRVLRGGTTDRALDRLLQIYDDLETMNLALAKRLKAAGSLNEATVNALVILNTYAQTVRLFLDEGLADISGLFEEYLSAEG